MAAVDDGDRRYSNPLTAFREAVACAERDPEGLEVAATDYAELVVGPRRADEPRDKYAVRVFASLLDESLRNAGTRDASRRRRTEWALYAGEAVETGHEGKASRWLWRLIADSPSDPAGLLLYGACRARHADLPSALVCARRAVALGGNHRLALFAVAALLMATGGAPDDGDGPPDEELETTLRRLQSEHPRFAEAHFLAAVHSCHTRMPARETRRLLSLAQKYAATDDDDDAKRLLAVLSAAWPPIRHSGDAAIACAALLAALELSDLAALCARSFTAYPDQRPSYHYLMAVLHHKRGEFDKSADHLAAMPDDDAHDGELRSLLAAHNDYGAGRTGEAMARYAALLSSRPSCPHYGLAYTRRARHLAARGEYAEAVDAYVGACTATRTPALMTELATCLAALDEPVAIAAAERLLGEAVALDGDNDGDAWNVLATVHARCGRAGTADACRLRAIVLGFKSRVGPVRDPVEHGSDLGKTAGDRPSPIDFAR